MRESLEEFCHHADKMYLLDQWDAERNAPLTPADVTYGSSKKIWWRCDKGHHWEAKVYCRTKGLTGCPYCSGKKVQTGKNDLAALYPDIATQWHPQKNYPQTPEQVMPSSHNKVWWVCDQGHEWTAQIRSRVAGCGCPICKNKKIVQSQNDLATVHPYLAAQWHPTKNGTLTPDQVGAGSSQRVWWQCEKGHVWKASILSRAHDNRGCPYCTGKQAIPGETDLATLYPDVAAQWHTVRNGNLQPQEVTAYSNKKVWWICPLGHEYPAVISSRTSQGSQCPYCSMRKVLPGFNDLATCEPRIAAQWHPTLNGDLTPSMVLPGSHKKVWWQCEEGHVWQAVLYSRTSARKCGCPVCAGSGGDRKKRRRR